MDAGPPMMALTQAPPPAVEAPLPEAPARDAGVDVEALLRRLTVEEKVGQLMMVGFGGKKVDEGIAALVRGRHVGGVCMFKRNISGAEQIARLNDEVWALLEGQVPPFIAVDQEGGNVVRVADGNLVLPGNMVLGATRSPALAYEAGRAQAEDLKRLGFNMNLAPVLDVNVNPRNPVIGIRAFGDDVALVSELGAEFVRGQQDAEVVSVAKHFPGHGPVDSDSHQALPVVHASAEEIRVHLQPFAAAMAAGLDGMMTAHIATPALSGDDTPATLSPRVLDGVLRREMGFDGLVLTDELEMHAIDRRYGVGHAAVLAVNAGADMVLIPWRVEKKTEVWEALLEAVRSGELPRTRLDQAVRRILTVKARRGVFASPLPLTQRLAALGGQRKLAAEIAAAGVTLVRFDAKSFPLSGATLVAVVTAEPSLALAVARRRPRGVGALVVPAFPRARDRAGLKRKTRELAEAAELTVLGVVNSNQLELLSAAASAGKPVVAVVMGVPYLAAQVGEASTVLVVYSYRDTTAEAAIAALFGEKGTPGKLPVALPRMPYGSGLNPVGARLAGTMPPSPPQ